MLRIILFPQDETFDEASSKFVAPSNGYVMDLEHSLVSLSKWESEFEKPFMTSEKTDEQAMAYVHMMILGDEPPPEIFARLKADDIKKIDDYIVSKQSATWFSNELKKSGQPAETITAELIYYWMISHNVPMECQHWHLNRLLTLIKVCNVKNAPKDQKGSKTSAADRRALNEQRKRQYGTTG